MTDTLLPPAVAALRLGVSGRTLRRMRSRGEVAWVERGNGQHGYSAASVKSLTTGAMISPVERVVAPRKGQIMAGKRWDGLRKRGRLGVYYARVGATEVSTGETDYQRARAARAKLLDRPLAGATEISLADWLPQYRELAALDKGAETVKGEAFMLAELQTRWGSLYLSRISTREVLEWVVAMKRRSLTGASINRRMSCLSVVLKKAQARGHLEALPALPRQRETPIHRKGFTLAEVGAVMDQARATGNAEVIIYLSLCAYTGMRRGTVARLNWEDIGDTIRLAPAQTKGRAALTLPINSELREVLDAYRGTGPVLRFGINHYDKVIRGLLKACGLYEAGRGVHALRRFFATAMLRSPSGDLETVRQLLGHKDISTTARYLDTNDQRQAAAVNSLSLRGGKVIPIRKDA
jgi:integrase